jgi:CDP-glucose 4,6-dehydratase
MGAKVYGLSLPPLSGRNLFTDAGVGEVVQDDFVDIRDADAVARAMRRMEPDIVLHLAAQSLVRPSYVDPIGTYATNVMGTVHLLAAAQQVESVRSLVVVTSDKCYENREWVWAYREDEPMGGHDPYSSSKGCAELVTSAWRSSFCSAKGGRALGLSSARAGNVVGGGDWAEDRLVPDCIRAIMNNKTIQIRNPNATRPWQHVLDPLCGYLVLAERLTEEPAKYAEGWNFGPAEEDAKPVGWIASRVAKNWGEGAEWQAAISAANPHEARFLKVDASKARAYLNWGQRLRIDRCLEWTVDWYRRYLKGESARQLTEQQIDLFCSLNVSDR